VVHCHNHHIHYYPDNSDDDKKKEGPATTAAIEDGNDPTTIKMKTEEGSSDHLLDAMRFRTRLSSNDETLGVYNRTGIYLWIAFLLLSSLILFLTGCLTEFIQFSSYGAGDAAVGCHRSYNLVTFGNAMVSESVLIANSAVAGAWTLYVAYILLVLFLPITVHCMQILLLVLASIGGYKEKNRLVCQWTASLWSFSSVEVLLIGVFAVEFKLDKFVSALAGNDNAQFFSVTSSLGPAFFVLIGYSLISNLLQYFIYCATTEHYRIDPYHKVHLIWTKLLQCWLEKK
jgi:hypothetical protein